MHEFFFFFSFFPCRDISEVEAEQKTLEEVFILLFLMMASSFFYIRHVYLTDNATIIFQFCMIIDLEPYKLLLL